MPGQDLEAFVFPSAETRSDYRDSIDPMDGRYADLEIQKYFSEDTRVATQAYVEAALVHTYADFGMCTRAVAIEVETASRDVSAQEVEAREYGRDGFTSPTRHDVVALTDAIGSRVSDEARPWIHAASTSYDIVSTAMSLQFRMGTTDLVMPRLVSFGNSIAELTERYASTPQVGRTHGQHGVPITFGFAMSRYLGRLGENLVRLQDGADDLQGKFSGAVGGYNASSLINADPRKFEQAFLAKLGLEPCEHATQIVPADNMLRLLGEMVISSGIMAQVGDDMRNLQRSEIAEVGEQFRADGQRGSSAMPNKRNPITFENAAGIHREVLGQYVNALLNTGSEHQRDLRDSVSMRFYPLIPAMVARTASTLAKTLGNLEVHTDNMRRNLYASGGTIGSEALQTVLRSEGDIHAYATAKRVVEDAARLGRPYRELLEEDDVVRPVLDRAPFVQRAAITSPETDYLGLCEAEANRHVKHWRHNWQDFKG